MATLIENVNRIYTDKENIKQAIINKGITVPDGTSLDDYADLISQINGGVDTSAVTATADDVLEGKVIVDADGNEVTGTITNQGSIEVESSYTVHESNKLGYSYDTNFPSGYYEELVVKGLSIDLADYTTATAGATDILSDKTAYINGIKLKGTMANIAAIDPCKSLVKSGNTFYARQSNGAHVTNATSGYPEVSIPQATFASAAGITEDKIVSGNTICGIEGTGTTKNRLEFALSTINTFSYSGGTNPTKWSIDGYSNIVKNVDDSYFSFTYNHNLGLISGKEYFVCMNLYDLGDYGFRIPRGYAKSSTTEQFYYTNVIPFTSHCMVGGNKSVGKLLSLRTTTSANDYFYVSVTLSTNSITYTLQQSGTSSAIAVRNTLDGINCSLVIAG